MVDSGLVPAREQSEAAGFFVNSSRAVNRSPGSVTLSAEVFRHAMRIS